MHTARQVTLDDKYSVSARRVYLSGMQALARLAILQRELDRRAGLKTAGFITGYRGSPIGGLDTELWRASRHLEAADILFRPGVNEDLAATSVWGTQQLDSVPGPRVDGVFAMWYGKGPGVDRSLDPIRHGNFTGTHRNGGVLAVFGDDQNGKSSTVVQQSEQALAACLVPVLNPANVEEIVRFGLLGWAMSRYSGLWVGLKTVNDTALQTSTIDSDLDALTIQRPEIPVREGPGLHYRPSQFTPELDERITVREKLPRALAFVRANDIDRTVFGAPDARLGIVTSGKAYGDVLDALRLLGLDRAAAERAGLALYKVGCIWPLEPQGLEAFARDKQELLFVEEKRAFVEPQATDILYRAERRPRIAGKRGPDGAMLLPSDELLTAQSVALALAARMEANGIGLPGIAERAKALAGPVAGGPRPAPSLTRAPYFCSGCPHNTSTVAPEGMYTGGGIGCHSMAVFIRPNMLTFTQMGGEGLNWAGLAPFTETPHIFQNMGDGTYFHSGLLAIRASIAAKVNVTYKILYNDAVAMTGGQPVDGSLSVAQVVQQVLTEGVQRCVIVTDQPERYRDAKWLPTNVPVYGREHLDRVQRELAAVKGCTILVYEQTCAAEKRRRRKRGKFPDPAKRVVINEAVCEGCGDCSTQSNCVSVVPVDTELGRKRQIDQSSCNKDYSCLRGFCPAMVTVYGTPRRPRPENNNEALLDPGRIAPPPPRKHHGRCEVMIAGIGGTGVVTLGAVLGMAAHIDGLAASVFDMTGLAQKGGAVYSHLRIGATDEQIPGQRIGAGEADLVLAADLVAALGAEAARTIRAEHTRIVGNARVTPTATFQRNPDVSFEAEPLLRQFRQLAGPDNIECVDAARAATTVCGDSIGANMVLVGYAAQAGHLPLTIQAIERAIELNGVEVAVNLKAFRLGRVLAADPAALASVLQAGMPTAQRRLEDVEDIVRHRTALLTDYQNAAYARRYETLVREILDAERSKAPGRRELSRAVARHLAKLMAYKDEYEVARLYSSAFVASVRAGFEPGARLALNMAPPVLQGSDPNGRPRKREFGPWMLTAMRLLTRLRGLRGTRLDPFGYTDERKLERRLIEEYVALVRRLAEHLTPDNYDTAVQLAELPESIRGFGHVKLRHLEAVKEREAKLLAEFAQPRAAAREAAVA